MWIHEIFEAQARRTPDNVAVTYDGRSLTYGEINERANQVARSLRTLGIGPESIVAIFLERCPDLVVALFAVLKAGGASLLLDPGYPAERVAYVLKDTRASVVLTQTAYAQRLADLEATVRARDQQRVANAVVPRRVVCLDDPSAETGREATGNLSSGIAIGSLAFVFYTSGSTGTPKAVMWCYGERESHLRWEAETFHLTERDRHLLRAPIGFTLLVAEVFVALLSGGHLIIVPTGLEQDPAYLTTLMIEHEISMLMAVPSLLQVLVDQGNMADCVSLREVCAIGEALSERLKQRVFQCSKARLSTMYGATEAPGAAFFRCERAPGDRAVQLGAPLAKREIYLLNDRLERVGTGESGEICLGGGLARGYFERPDLTAAKFVPHPFSAEPGARLYRTGDLGRSLPDGGVEFIGRMDDQLNLRGFRIEPGEIEKAICEHSAISQAAVTVREDKRGEARLVAYVTGKTGSVPSSGALRRHLSDRLPTHMIPELFVTLAAMPLTPNGKLDRRALPDPDGTRPRLDVPYVAASSAVQQKLIQIWAQLLGIGTIGVQDNFFDLGGNSLLAIKLITQINRVFGKHLPLPTLLQAPTIEQLAHVISRSTWLETWSALVPIQPHGSKPPFFWVHGDASTLPLAASLGTDQPLYALEHQSQDGKTARYTTVETIASHYLDEVRSVQSAGPYFLGGFSFGGMIAFEMAQQLRTAGQNVELLMLLDSHFPGAEEVDPVRSEHKQPLGAEVRRHLRRVAILDPRDRLAYLLVRLKGKLSEQTIRATRPLKTLYCKIWLRNGRPVPAALLSHYLLGIYRKAGRAYQPRPYSGRVLYIKSEKRSSYHRLSWAGIIDPELDYHEIPGDHLDVITEPYAHYWADTLKDALDAAWRNPST